MRRAGESSGQGTAQVILNDEAPPRCRQMIRAPEAGINEEWEQGKTVGSYRHADILSIIWFHTGSKDRHHRNTSQPTLPDSSLVSSSASLRRDPVASPSSPVPPFAPIIADSSKREEGGLCGIGVLQATVAGGSNYHSVTILPTLRVTDGFGLEPRDGASWVAARVRVCVRVCVWWLRSEANVASYALLRTRDKFTRDDNWPRGGNSI